MFEGPSEPSSGFLQSPGTGPGSRKWKGGGLEVSLSIPSIITHYLSVSEASHYDQVRNKMLTVSGSMYSMVEHQGGSSSGKAIVLRTEKIV